MSAEFEAQSDRVKGIIKRLSDSLVLRKAGRSTWENHWQECFDYIIPDKANVTRTKNAGEKAGVEVYDDTAINSNVMLASALSEMLTNTTTRFFDMIMNDQSDNEDDEVKRWLQDTSSRIFQTLNNSNYHQEMHSIYLDLGAIGTACLYIGEHDENIVHFSARPIKEIYPDENNLGVIDKVDRVFEWTPRQIVQEFGEKDLPAYVVEAYKKGVDEKWKVVHSVLPASEIVDEKGPHPFKSFYWLEDKKLMLAEKGYFEFPYAIPRWIKNTGEIYGRGPGMNVLPSIKQLNAMVKTTIRGAQKTVDPPLMVANDGVIGQVNLTPSGLTVVDSTAMDGVPIRPLITNARVDFGLQLIENVQQKVKAGFHIDQLSLGRGPQMTATEVERRGEDQARTMGSILSRQQPENLRTTLVRVFGIMLRKGKLLPPPKQIHGKEWDVRYTSMIARVQRQNEAANITRAISVVAPIVNVDPKTIDNLNTDSTFRFVMDKCGVPAALMNDKRTLGDIREQRRKAEADALAAQQAKDQADVVSKVAPGAAQLQMAQREANQ